MTNEINKEIFSLKHNNATILYFKKYNKAIYCSNTFAKSIKKGDKELMKTLFFKEKFSSPIKNEISKSDFVPTNLTILPSLICNLECIYCYASASEKKDDIVSINAAFSSIDYIIENANTLNSKEIGLNFHGGGEPLHPYTQNLVLNSLKYAIKQTNKNSLNLKTHIATNGTILNGKALEIIDLIQNFTVSFDAPQSSQDYHRPLTNGKSSFKKVLSTIEYLTKKNKYISIRSTITNKNVHLMPEMIDFYYNLGIKSLHFEPLSVCGRCESAVNLKAPKVDSFVKYFIEAKYKAEKYEISLFTTSDKLFSVNGIFCGVQIDNFYLIPKDIISACNEVCYQGHKFSDKFFIGKFDNNKLFLDRNAIKNIKSKSTFYRTDCENCIAQNSCGGGCAVRNLLSNEGQDMMCELNKKFFIHNLKNKIDMSLKNKKKDENN